MHSPSITDEPLAPPVEDWRPHRLRSMCKGVGVFVACAAPVAIIALVVATAQSAGAAGGCGGG
jgi:hypothetical protein